MRFCAPGHNKVVLLQGPTQPWPQSLRILQMQLIRPPNPAVKANSGYVTIRLDDIRGGIRVALDGVLSPQVVP
jgi:hypothetical protein